jgi:hypothetical protein
VQTQHSWVTEWYNTIVVLIEQLKVTCRQHVRATTLDQHTLNRIPCCFPHNGIALSR